MKVPSMYDKEFWKDTGIRTINTFFQALVGAIGSSAIFLEDVAWVPALSTASLAAVVVVFKALSVPPVKAAYSARRALE